MPARFYDAHNHLHDEWLLPHRDQVLADIASCGIAACVVNGTQPADWPHVAALAANHAVVRPSFGVHPWELGNCQPTWRQQLLAQLDSNPSAVVGEIGLDRWMLDQARPDDPRLAGLRRASIEEQMEAFRWQFSVAAERNLPATVHCLNAFGALHDILRSAPAKPRRFLLHAYSGPAEMVPVFVKFGAYFSFNGAFLDPRKQRLREVYAIVPCDRLLVETDAPAMRLPGPLERFTLPDADGQHVNHPANLVAAYNGLAKIRGVPLDQLAQEVEYNFTRLFR